jgi:hypothetical protein
VFLQREYAHITSNPEIQWYKKQFKQEQEDLENDMKIRFKEQQTKARHKRREMMKQYQEEELNKLKSEEKQRKLDKA